MAIFLYHTQCPNCAEAGEDTSRDNLGIYSDGSSFCFKCGQYSPGNGQISYKEKPPVEVPLLSSTLPDADMQYLRKYLSEEEIKRWFRYAPKLRRHVFLVEDNGEVFWTARSAIGGLPKVLSFGSKIFSPFWNPNDKTKTLVIVEDVISAICAYRLLSSLPLFGSFMPNKWISNVCRDSRFDNVIVWLDNDKFGESINISRKIGMFKPCRIIHTEKDPKDFSYHEMRKLIESSP